MTDVKRRKIQNLSIRWAVALSLIVAIGGAGLCSALMMQAIPTFGWMGWIVSMVYAGGIAGVVIFSQLNGKPVSLWDPTILALTIGILILRVVEGTHEHVAIRQDQRSAAVTELAACEEKVRRTRQTKARTYRGIAPTARGREWDAEEKEGLRNCRHRTPIPPAPKGNGLAELDVLDWFMLVGPCVIDFSPIGLVKRFGAAAIDVALRGDDYEDRPKVHPALKGVDLTQLPPEVVAHLDVAAGTYRGALLGPPQWRRVAGGRVLWPVLLDRTTPSGGVAFVGAQRLMPSRVIGQPVANHAVKTPSRSAPRRALGTSFRPPSPPPLTGANSPLWANSGLRNQFDSQESGGASAHEPAGRSKSSEIVRIRHPPNTGD